VLELKSPSDDLVILQAKLQEYIDNGAQLAWLIDSEHQQVYCYRPRQPVQLLNQPSRLSGETLLPNFVMDLTLIWE